MYSAPTWATVSQRKRKGEEEEVGRRSREEKTEVLEPWRFEGVGPDIFCDDFFI